MTKQSARRADVTLPLLIDYIDALLPTLTQNNDVQADAQTTAKEGNDKPELLWVTEDKNTLSSLSTELKNHASFKEGSATTEPADGYALSTLLALSQQPVSERYELVCFWLPTLSAEILQQYIPLLMRYRDLYAAHLLIAIDSSIDLKAYGFTPFDIVNEPFLATDNLYPKDSLLLMTNPSISATLWQFNLYDYKQLPNWLNADYWANPENWGKHRW